jgi:hypothetical protein
MENKICPHCKVEKSSSEFHKRRDDDCSSYCKICLYQVQKSRWLLRKKEAVDLLGGKCCKCGYDKNLGALHFHHIDPNLKEYTWNKMRLMSWSNMIDELKKCILVCGNCHAEIHYPNLNNFESHRDANIFFNKTLQPTGNCPMCGGDMYGTKYCSQKCAKMATRKVKRPPLEILLKEIEELGYVKTGKKYGVSDNAIRKWIKQ